MDFSQKIRELIGQGESGTLEYKAVMLPSRGIAQLIAGFANSEGGYIILGVSDRTGQFEVNGLSQDFQANAILHKALDILSPMPNVQYQYVGIDGKNVYAIEVSKSEIPVLLEGKHYKRTGKSV